MTVPLPVLPALQLFETDVTIRTDSKGYDANRRPTEVVGTPFIVRGSFQPATSEDIKFFPEGSIADGAFVLWTRTELEFTNTKQGSTDQDQTYVLFEGNEWRILGPMDWNVYGQFRRYACTKYVRQ